MEKDQKEGMKINKNHFDDVFIVILSSEQKKKKKEKKNDKSKHF